MTMLMVGLQGAGKTTLSAKLAKRMTERQGKKVLMASLDDRRPAAKEQLRVLGEQVGRRNAAHLSRTRKPVDIARRALREGKLGGYDVLILDTAGRTHIDDELMAETAAVKAATNPHEILLVADALTGQDAVNLARSFDQRVDITGIVLTRVDGDGRGGAALSMRAATGKPIKLLGTGEKMDALEEFAPSRVADRILGMGDIVGLVEKAAETIKAEDAAKMAKKLKKGIFDLDDLRGQLTQMKNMGGMGALMGMMPGMGQIKKAMAGANLDEKVFDRQIAIINSMTKTERAEPDVLNAKRRIRIAKGSGTKVEDVNKLMKQHRQMADMMKKVGKGGMGALSGMFGGKMGQMMPGLGSMDPSKMDPAQLEAMARQMGIDPAAMQQAAGAPRPKQLSDKLPADVGQLLKSGSGLPGLGGAPLPWPSRSRRRLRAEEEIDRTLQTPTRTDRMSLKLRLARAGTTKRPYYHVVVADARSPARRPLHREGRHL